MPGALALALALQLAKDVPDLYLAEAIDVSSPLPPSVTSRP